MPVKLTPSLFGWSLWWNGWELAHWDHSATSRGLGPFSLEKEYTA